MPLDWLRGRPIRVPLPGGAAGMRETGHCGCETVAGAGHRLRGGPVELADYSQPNFGVMLLTLDIGNTEITVGLFQGAELEAHWRLTTNPDRTPDEWGSAIGGFLMQAGTRRTKCGPSASHRWRPR